MVQIVDFFVLDTGRISTLYWFRSVYVYCGNLRETLYYSNLKFGEHFDIGFIAEFGGHLKASAKPFLKNYGTVQSIHVGIENKITSYPASRLTTANKIVKDRRAKEDADLHDEILDDYVDFQSKVSFAASLENAASLFGLEDYELKNGLTTRVVQLAKGGVRGTNIRLDTVKSHDASAARDALAKEKKKKRKVKFEILSFLLYICKIFTYK
ncbi:unnamed protein product [Brugia pahangi]|uniref:SAC domain-containing protein n=1 Tax=Brugia pahangi TaxID=6280 RepID=A0A0N4T338_BRUPA|nr:unnamed protein product [Brugia pahangi]